jgi:hypothetical protein
MTTNDALAAYGCMLVLWGRPLDCDGEWRCAKLQLAGQRPRGRAETETCPSAHLSARVAPSHAVLPRVCARRTW